MPATNDTRARGLAFGFKERLWAYADPGLLILVAMKEFVLTALHIAFVERSPSTFLHLRKLRDRAFSDFWQAVSPPPLVPKEGESPQTLEGSLSLLIPHFDEISGVVLDLGPGTGHLTHYYPAQNISAIYGAEPNEGLHGALRTNATASGLGDRYHVLSCGAEAKTLIPALKDAGLLKFEDGVDGVFDTIVAARVLCGVPDLQENLMVLYALLKPGGKFVIVEHVVNPWKDRDRGSVAGRLLQVLYKPLWEFFIRCHLDADTETLLKRTGERNAGWQRMDLRRRLEWSPLAWIGGVLVKRVS